MLEPAAPPDPQTSIGRINRADHMAIAKPSRLGLDHAADAAPRPREMVDPAPPGRQPVMSVEVV